MFLNFRAQQPNLAFNNRRIANMPQWQVGIPTPQAPQVPIPQRAQAPHRAQAPQVPRRHQARAGNVLNITPKSGVQNVTSLAQPIDHRFTVKVRTDGSQVDAADIPTPIRMSTPAGSKQSCNGFVLCIHVVHHEPVVSLGIERSEANILGGKAEPGENLHQCAIREAICEEGTSVPIEAFDQDFLDAFADKLERSSLIGKVSRSKNGHLWFQTAYVVYNSYITPSDRVNKANLAVFGRNIPSGFGEISKIVHIPIKHLRDMFSRTGKISKHVRDNEGTPLVMSDFARDMLEIAFQQKAVI